MNVDAGIYRNLLNRWVARHGKQGEDLTDLTLAVLDGRTKDEYYEEKRRASGLGPVLESRSNGSGDRDVAVLD